MSTSVDGFVDSHCHLYDTRGADVDDVIAAARAAGVTTMVNVGCDAATTAAAISIAERYADVYATAGLHPHEAVHGVDTITGLIDHPRVIAIGEAGLDYYYDHSPRAVQREAFAAQIHLARDRGLPLIVHTRDAWDDTFEVLAAEGVPDRIVFHCFTGGPDEASRCLEIGGYLSFSGIVTFPTATAVRESAVRCPADRMLVETDSPYLAPVPRRGRTNQPGYVVHVAQCIADLRGESLEAVRAATVAATCAAFPALRP